VGAVIPYYQRFLTRFPSVEALAAADENEVLRLWSGLGYYARARNLHAAAKQVVARGGFPTTAEAILELPGIGRSTAAAIAAFAFGRRGAILDGNVKRVLARAFGIAGWPGEREVETQLWSLAESLLPERGIETYTQGLMDLGATVCTRTKPACDACPVAQTCLARREGRIAEIPSPRPRKAIPVRTANWLVLRHAGQVLLERRPSMGLWGGLWTFPEWDTAPQPRQTVLGYSLGATRELSVLEHGFTHFRLRVQPFLCDVPDKPPRTEMPGRIWLGVADAVGAAVPVPVRKILTILSGGAAAG
jgi:A/G-specific adenine glycosylase